MTTVENAPKAQHWEVEANPRSGVLRLVLTGDGGPLASIELSAPNAYELAQSILRGYDRLEGI